MVARGGGRARAGAGAAGPGGGWGGYGIQDETDPAGIVVPASTVVPEELGLQLDEATLVGLEIIEEGHCAVSL